MTRWSSSGLRRTGMQAFLVFFAAWPAVQYVAASRYDYDPWHGAGWAMYLSPPRLTEVDFRQSDGSPLPGEVTAMHSTTLIVQAAMTQGRLFDLTPRLEALVTKLEPGLIDGVYLCVERRRWNGWQGTLAEPAVLHEIVVLAPEARSPDRTASGGVVRPPAGAWTRTSDGAVLRFDGAGRASSDGFRDATTSQTACGDFPGCMPMDDGGMVPFYIEGASAWVAECGGSAATERYRRKTDDELRDEGLVVVWRSRLTTCVVGSDAPAWELVAGVEPAY